MAYIWTWSVSSKSLHNMTTRCRSGAVSTPCVASLSLTHRPLETSLPIGCCLYLLPAFEFGDNASPLTKRYYCLGRSHLWDIAVPRFPMSWQRIHTHQEASWRVGLWGSVSSAQQQPESSWWPCSGFSGPGKIISVHRCLYKTLYNEVQP